MANDNVPKTSASAQDSMIREWIYYRVLQHGESEFPLRNKQVGGLYMRDLLLTVTRQIFHLSACLEVFQQLDCTTSELYTQ